MLTYFDVLVAYDIQNNRHRNEVFEQLRDLGLTPVQKSVFWGRILPAEERAVLSYLRSAVVPPDRAIVLKGNFLDQLRSASCGYPGHTWETPSHVCL